MLTLRRNLVVCGLALLAVGLLGLAGQARTGAGLRAVPGGVAAEVQGGQIGTYNCLQLREDPLVHCNGRTSDGQACTPYHYYVEDPNGPYNNQRCYKVCAVGGMSCGAFNCEGCEILLPCNHPLCETSPCPP
jgi:hypothetical protein